MNKSPKGAACVRLNYCGLDRADARDDRPVNRVRWMICPSGRGPVKSLGLPLSRSPNRAARIPGTNDKPDAVRSYGRRTCTKEANHPALEGPQPFGPPRGRPHDGRDGRPVRSRPYRVAIPIRRAAEHIKNGARRRPWRCRPAPLFQYVAAPFVDQPARALIRRTTLPPSRRPSR